MSNLTSMLVSQAVCVCLPIKVMQFYRSNSLGKDSVLDVDVIQFSITAAVINNTAKLNRKLMHANASVLSVIE